MKKLSDECYENLRELFQKYESWEDVPEEELMKLGIDIRNEYQAEWLQENFGAIQSGYKSQKEFIEDNCNMLGFDPDTDSITEYCARYED